MQQKYGYKAVSELEILAAQYGVERLRVYTHRQFMRALVAAEEAAESERAELAENPILKVAKPILEKASEEIMKKIRTPRKIAKLTEAAAALTLFKTVPGRPPKA